jgi:hypothetical protein
VITTLNGTAHSVGGPWARRSLSTTTALPAASYFTIPYDIVDWDNWSMSTVAGGFVVPMAGRYRFSVSCSFTPTATTRGLRIYKNGATTRSLTQITSYTNVSGAQTIVSELLDNNVLSGDTFILQCQSVAASSIYGTNGGADANSWFAVNYLGSM